MHFKFNLNQLIQNNYKFSYNFKILKYITCYFRLRSHNKRPHRVDVTKLPNIDVDNGPTSKTARSNAGPGLIRAELDPNSSDHVVAMTQLKEQIASLQKQLTQKDSQLLSKDKMVMIKFHYMYCLF